MSLGLPESCVGRRDRLPSVPAPLTGSYFGGNTVVRSIMVNITANDERSLDWTVIDCYHLCLYVYLIFNTSLNKLPD